MRALAIVLIFVTACGSKQPGPGAGPAGGNAQVAAVFPAARFVPAQPTYVVSARSMRDLQRGMVDVLDVVGTMLGRETSDASANFRGLIGIDPFDANGLAQIGVDLDGSAVLFSEDVFPTFVMHLKSPDAMTSYLEGQRQRGVRTQSAVVGKTEVLSVQVEADFWVSWAVEADWLWLHFSDGKLDPSGWFAHSKQPSGAQWVDSWKWAQALAPTAGALVGHADLARILKWATDQDAGAITCARALSAVKRVGFSGDTDGKKIVARLAFDLGADSQSVAANLLPTPPGWATASANAPLSAQWNLDLAAAARLVQSCMANAQGQGPDLVGELDQYGVRSARAFVHKLDPDDKEGVGAVSADLSHARFIRGLLDGVPGRSTFEKSRTFGIYKGKHISVPFVASADYVLQENLAIAAMGDGVLAQVGTASGPPGAAPTPPLFAIDIRPAGLSAGVWQWIAAQIEIDDPKRFAQRLLLWQDIHVGARLDGSSLVIEAAGNRR